MGAKTGKGSYRCLNVPLESLDKVWSTTDRNKLKSSASRG